MSKLINYLKLPAVWGSLLSVLAIAVVAFCFFYPDASLGNSLRQHDMLQGVAIGQEAKAFHEATGETTHWTNSLFSGMPTFQISPKYESSGLFMWINKVYGLGLPSPSSLLAMMMLGFFILLMVMRARWYVALIGTVAYGLSSYFVIIIGAGHIWKFVTLAYIPPTIAGIVLCYRRQYVAGAALTAVAAMMQIANNHLQMSYYFLAVCLGFAIVYLVYAWRMKKVAQWGVSTAVLAVAAALAIGANSPSLYNTYEYSKETMRGRHSELTQPDAAQNASKGLDRNYITAYSYGRAESFSLMIPSIKGGASARPVGGQMRAMTMNELPAATEMLAKGEITMQDAGNLGGFSQYFGEPEGTNGPVYVGAIIVALFLLGCIIVRGPMKWMLLVLTLLSIGLALGRNLMWLTDLFIDYVPMYSKFRTVESILVIAEFTMPLLAMLALRKMLRHPEVNYSRPLLYSFGACLFVCLLGMFVPSVFGSYIGGAEQIYLDNDIDKQFPTLFAALRTLRYGMVSSDSMRSFFYIAAAGIALWFMIRGRLRAGWAMAIVGVLVLADLYTVDKRYLSHNSFCSPELTATDPFPINVYDQKILPDTSMNYRVMDIPRFNLPDPSYRHKMIGGYHAAKLTRYQDLIDRHLSNLLKIGYYEGLRNDSTGLALVNGDENQLRRLRADLHVLDMLNARYIINKDESFVTNPYALGNAWFVGKIDYVDTPDAEMAALSEIDPGVTAVADAKFRDVLGEASEVCPGDTVFETSYAPNRLTYSVDSRRGGIVVFSEIYFPWGWHVEIDGEPAELGRVDYVLRALRVPAGHHSVVMTFDPESLHVTNAISTASVVIIYLLCAAALAGVVLRRRRSATV